MRTAERALPFAGTDEELERYLAEFARAAGFGPARDPRRGGWLLAGGAALSSNPNTLPLRLRITRSGSELLLSGEFRALPWTRAKLGRVAEHRIAQLADYLTSRVRGSGPEKFAAVPLAEPYAPLGSGVAALTASFAWIVLTGLSTFVVALLAVTLAALPLLRYSIHEIAEHSNTLMEAGAIPLPSPAEAGSECAFCASFIFAVPIAFFCALVHTAALAVSELGRKTARLPQASVLFLGVLLLLAWVPYWLPLRILSVPFAALGVPAAVHLGSTAVWGRRRERLRDGPRPAKAMIIIAVCLSASLAGAAVPRAVEWSGALNRIALFRDAWLLGNPAGRKIAAAYYRHTLYSAELLKEFYSTTPERPRKQQPIASVSERKYVPMARALGFAVIHGAGGDVVIGDRVGCRLSIRTLARSNDLAELKVALDQVSDESFQGTHLRELSSLGWRSVYYAGPLAVLLAVMGVLAPFVSLLFRRLKPQTAVFALSAIAIVTSLGLVLLTSPREGEPNLAEDLTDARADVRHEAAYRACQLDSTSALTEPLLKAADDADLRVRLWAVAALGRSGDPRVYETLARRLDDPELFVRYRAAEGLGHLRDARAIPALERVMRERRWYEGAYALEALRRIRPGAY